MITVLVFFDFAWRHLQAVLNLDQAGTPIDVNDTPHSPKHLNPGICGGNYDSRPTIKVKC